MSEWKPITTAPKDGRKVLLGNPAIVGSGHYWQSANRRYPRERWVWDGWPQHEPTKWQPLPEPPK